MRNWLLELILRSASVFIVTLILSSVQIESITIAVVVAFVYGLLKTLFRGILVFFSLPLIVLTLGLFWFVINACLLWITDRLIDGFEIEGFINTIIASILISLMDIALHWLKKGANK